MSHKKDCIFCQIAQGKAPAHVIWEDEYHVAFLSIFPNTKGYSVLITKEHYSSDVFSLDESVYTKMMRAAKQVSKKLEKAFEDVGRVGLMVEGFGVDHAHVKFFPMHGTGNMKEWKMIESGEKRDEFYNNYPGYLSSHDSKRADDKWLASVAKKIRNVDDKS